MEMMIVAEWTGFKNVNVPAFIACFTIVGLIAVLGVYWLRKPETKQKGILLLAMIIVPTAMSALALILRLLV